MRLASISLAALLVLSAGLYVVGQDAGTKDDAPPKPTDTHAQSDRPERPRWGRGHRPSMNEQQVRDAIEVLRQIDPEKAEKLEQYIADNPERIGQALHKNFPHLGRFLAMRRFDPDGFDLRIKDLRLSRQSQLSARRFHEATQAGNDTLAAAELAVLEGLVADHFDVRQQIREHDLAKLENQIQELKDQLQDRTDNRDELIADRIEEFVSQEDTDHW